VKRILLITMATGMLLALAGALLGCGVEGVSPLQATGRLKVATTTSLYDTGLWGYLEPMFEDRYGVELDVLYAGTGKALEWGRRGDVDVITVHSKAREEQFVADGYGVERVPFAYNYFLIVGPESDPAGISDMSPEAAFTQLMSEGKTRSSSFPGETIQVHTAKRKPSGTAQVTTTATSRYREAGISRGAAAWGPPW